MKSVYLTKSVYKELGMSKNGRAPKKKKKRSRADAREKSVRLLEVSGKGSFKRPEPTGLSESCCGTPAGGRRKTPEFSAGSPPKLYGVTGGKSQEPLYERESRVKRSPGGSEPADIRGGSGHAGRLPPGRGRCPGRGGEFREAVFRRSPTGKVAGKKSPRCRTVHLAGMNSGEIERGDGALTLFEKGSWGGSTPPGPKNRDRLRGGGQAAENVCSRENQTFGETTIAAPKGPKGE